MTAAPPRFVRKEEDSMYGAKGHPVTIEFWVYGCPEPQVTWFKGESQVILNLASYKLNLVVNDNCFNCSKVPKVECITTV